jgi:hypothetical protein
MRRKEEGERRIGVKTTECENVKQTEEESDLIEGYED